MREFAGKKSEGPREERTGIDELFPTSANDHAAGKRVQRIPYKMGPIT
jgi:hypothetical protein